MRTKFYAGNFLGRPGHFCPLANMLDFTKQYQWIKNHKLFPGQRCHKQKGHPDTSYSSIVMATYISSNRRWFWFKVYFFNIFICNLLPQLFRNFEIYHNSHNCSTILFSGSTLRWLTFLQKVFTTLNTPILVSS